MVAQDEDNDVRFDLSSNDLETSTKENIEDLECGKSTLPERNATENNKHDQITYSCNSTIKTHVESKYILYRRRWLVLLLFIVYSASNAFNWLDLVMITNVLEKYYEVNTLAITWTSMIYMAVYIPLIFPATWYLQKKGLRSCIILGSLGNCIGSWIKFIDTVY